jgi:hypothetical protein
MEAIKSKKFIALVISLIAAILSVYLDIPEERLETLLWTIGALTGAYQLGQGAADFGKEKEKQRQQAPGFTNKINFNNPAEMTTAQASEMLIKAAKQTLKETNN